MAEVRGRKARLLHNDAISRVELGKARREGQEVPASDLGQRQLASLQRGEEVARLPQPGGQKEQRWGEGRELSSPEEESVAELHRAQMGTWKAQGRRAGWVARGIRARRQGVPGLRLSALRASHHSTEGSLIMH